MENAVSYYRGLPFWNQRSMPFYRRGMNYKMHPSEVRSTSTATVLSRNAENVPRQADTTADGVAECNLTKPNVSTDCSHRQGARPKNRNAKRSVMTSTLVNRLQNRCLRDSEEECPREETESRKPSNHNTRKVGIYKKWLLTPIQPTAWIGTTFWVTIHPPPNDHGGLW